MISKKSYKIPLYYGKLIIIKTDDLKEISDKYGLNERAESCNAFVFTKDSKKDGFRVYVVFKRIDIDIIAHETVHVVNMIYEQKGMSLDVVNDEPQAYLTGWVFKKIYKHINNN